jgi:ankyrin repeat protein
MTRTRKTWMLVAAVVVVVTVCGWIAVRRSITQYFLNEELAGAALFWKDTSKVSQLLNRGADPNFEGDGNLLREAVKNGSTEIAELLLSKGADPSAALASVTEAEEIPKLVMLGANVNAEVGLSGETPLMLHALYGNEVVVRELLNQGASVTAKDRSGKTIEQRLAYILKRRPDAQSATHARILRLHRQARSRR